MTHEEPIRSVVEAIQSLDGHGKIDWKPPDLNGIPSGNDLWDLMVF